MISEERLVAIKDHLEITHPDGSHPLEASRALELISTIRELQGTIQEQADLIVHQNKKAGERIEQLSNHERYTNSLQAENERLKELMPKIGETCKFRYLLSCIEDMDACEYKRTCRNGEWELKDVK